jgi:hypothetical protein
MLFTLPSCVTCPIHLPYHLLTSFASELVSTGAVRFGSQFIGFVGKFPNIFEGIQELDLPSLRTREGDGANR